MKRGPAMAPQGSRATAGAHTPSVFSCWCWWTAPSGPHASRITEESSSPLIASAVRVAAYSRTAGCDGQSAHG